VAPVRDLHHLLVVVDAHHGVGRGDPHVDGLVGLEHLDAVPDDPGGQQQTHRVVEQDVALLLAERRESRPRRGVARPTARAAPL
jgi:hypothetical protein